MTSPAPSSSEPPHGSADTSTRSGDSGEWPPADPPQSPRPPWVDDGSPVSPRVRNAIAIVIITAWALGMVADAAMSTWSLNPLVHGIVFGLGCAVYGSNFAKGLR
jgi:hypothetical protein